MSLLTDPSLSQVRSDNPATAVMDSTPNIRCVIGLVKVQIEWLLMHVNGLDGGKVGLENRFRGEVYTL